MEILSLLGSVFNEVFFRPIVNLLVLILSGLTGSHIPGALGWAIVILTILIRFLVWPFMGQQLKSAKKMAELKPHLDLLKEKHKDSKTDLSKAQMELYKEHGVNPAGGCLPSLIQIPVIIALYQTIQAFFSTPSQLERINTALYNPAWKLNFPPNLNFFGINLAVKPSEFGSVGLLVLLIPILTALLQFIQSKMMTAAPVKPYPSDSPKEIKEKSASVDTQGAMQTQMMYMMPLMIGYFAFQFPIGLAIYWNTFTVLGIIQQYLISGWGGIESWIKFLRR